MSNSTLARMEKFVLQRGVDVEVADPSHHDQQALPIEFEKLTVVALKKLLKEKIMVQGGNKAELVRRFREGAIPSQLADGDAGKRQAKRPRPANNDASRKRTSELAPGDVSDASARKSWKVFLAED